LKLVEFENLVKSVKNRYSGTENILKTMGLISHQKGLFY